MISFLCKILSKFEKEYDFVFNSFAEYIFKE